MSRNHKQRLCLLIELLKNFFFDVLLTYAGSKHFAGISKIMMLKIRNVSLLFDRHTQDNIACVVQRGVRSRD